MYSIIIHVLRAAERVASQYTSINSWQASSRFLGRWNAFCDIGLILIIDTIVTWTNYQEKRLKRHTLQNVKCSSIDKDIKVIHQEPGFIHESIWNSDTAQSSHVPGPHHPVCHDVTCLGSWVTRDLGYWASGPWWPGTGSPASLLSVHLTPLRPIINTTATDA